MTTQDRDFLNQIERELKDRFGPATPTKSQQRKGVPNRPLPSDASVVDRQHRLTQLVLPDNQRAKMPLTKDKYLVKENPANVFWEREVRKFLRNLSPEHSHRVSAVMIFEWATGLYVRDLDAAYKEARKQGDRSHQKWRSDLRIINSLLRHYFGKSYMTYIAGRKVPKAYNVRAGYYIKRHRPVSLELYVEYCEGTLIA
jgi:hypothetical protein